MKKTVNKRNKLVDYVENVSRIQPSLVTELSHNVVTPDKSLFNTDEITVNGKEDTVNRRYD